MRATWMPLFVGRVLEPDSIEVKEAIRASIDNLVSANYSVVQSKYTQQK
jgi:hypothetical protein